MATKSNRIKELEESIAKMQLELGYHEAMEVILDVENVVLIPNDYLREHYGTEYPILKRFSIDARSFSSTTVTEKEMLKRINDMQKQIKEFFTGTDTGFIKPLKEATKKYFAYTASPRW